MKLSLLDLPFERAAPEELRGLPYSTTMRKIMAQWRESHDYWKPQYDIAKRDKQFVQSKQWQKDVEQAREKNNVATVSWPLIRNFYNHQIGKALPGSVDFTAVCMDPADGEYDDKEKALAVQNGMIRFINKRSKAHAHRQKARRDQFSGGIGWLGMNWHPSDGPADGELRIFSPKYFNSVYIDPHYSEPDASDANYSFSITRMPWEIAKGKYGDRIKKIVDKHGDEFTMDTIDDCIDRMSTIDHCKAEEWVHRKGREVSIALHHWRRKIKIRIYDFNGYSYTESQWTEAKKTAKKNGIDVSEATSKTYEGYMVEQREMCGWSVLEEETFFLSRIPWTPVLGYTMEDGEQMTHHGIVHDGVNLQEHANWLASQHATKTARAKTIALIGNGTMPDGGKPFMTRGGIEFYNVDLTEDGTSQTPAQVINSPDDGTKELEYLRFTLEVLRQIMSTDNDTQDNQTIRSAEQLNLHLSDRDSVREELDQNYRMALESHYSKVIEAIQELYSQDDVVRIVDLDEHDERIGTEKFIETRDFSRYTVHVKMTPSGTAQKQQSQQIANALMSSGDPAKVTMGLILGVDTTELSNKGQLMKRLYKQAFLAGNIADIPPEMLEQIIEEQQETGQIQQTLQRMAQPMAEQMLQEILQDKGIQAEIAKHEFAALTASKNAERASHIANKAVVDRQGAERSEALQLEQQRQQTMQEQLRNARQFYELQQEIAEAEAKGVEIKADLIRKIIELENPFPQRTLN